MRLLKQLAVLSIVAGIGLCILGLFSYEVIKVDWVSFMEIQGSYTYMEHPLPVPSRSIPVEGPAYVPGMGAPESPVPADAVSIARGAELYSIHCSLCHGTGGQGDGKVAAFLQNRPANLTLPVVQNMSDGTLFLTITFGLSGRMPALNENLLVRERWDIVNFLRTLAAGVVAQ